jgi:hypothetical protein
METQSDTKRIKKAGMAGAGTEVIAGIAAGVLAILGLIGVEPGTMLSVAAMILGVGLMAESGAISAAYSRLATSGMEKPEVGGGLSAEGAAGIAALALGILAIVGVVPGVLLPSAAIVLGAGLLFGTGVNDRFRRLSIHASSDRTDRLTSESVAAANGAQVLVGIGAITLGVLALVGLVPVILTLVAMLSIGVSLLLSGSALATRLGAMKSY